MIEAFQQETGLYIEEMKSGTNSILVTIRVRPLSTKEKNFSTFQTINVLDGKLIVIEEPEAEGPETMRKNRFKENKFAFDFVFDQAIDTRQIYESTVEGMLEGVMEGYHSTVLAYGATSCGKTFTMMGEGDKHPGIMGYTVLDLLNRIQQERSDKNIKLKASYIEIYNENIKDLLISDDRNFDIRQDPKEGVHIPGINEVTVENISQLKTVLKVGCRNRTKENTYLNIASSRSHAILQLHVEVMDRNPSTETIVYLSKFSLVDLAGSERGGALWNNNQRIVEGNKINQSLLVLGNCIQALSEANQKGTKNVFVPYRGSKLTRLLKDALGGNCRTIMIGHVSPSTTCMEETYNTLVYVNRAKNIKNNVVRNNLIAEVHVSNYANVIKNLKKENEDLKIQLKKQRNKISNTRLPPLQGQKYENQTGKWQKKIDQQFQNELQIVKQIGQVSKKIEILAFQIFACQLNGQKTIDFQKQASQLSSNKLILEEKLLACQEYRQILMEEVKKNEGFNKSGISSLLSYVKQKKVSLQILSLKIKEDALKEEKQLIKGLIQVMKKKANGQKQPQYEPKKLILKKNNIISRLTFSQLQATNELNASLDKKSGEKNIKSIGKNRKYIGGKAKEVINDSKNLFHDYTVKKMNYSPIYGKKHERQKSPNNKSRILDLSRKMSSRNLKISEDQVSKPKYQLKMNRVESGKVKNNKFDFVFLPH